MSRKQDILINVLDDDLKRHGLLEQFFRPRLEAQITKRNIRFVRFLTADSLIDQLTEDAEADTIVHVLFLDHDLGGEVYVDSGREDCGMEVVRAMEAYHYPHVLQTCVHTMNPMAGDEMRKRLQAAGYCHVRYVPFGVLIQNWAGYNDDTD